MRSLLLILFLLTVTSASAVLEEPGGEARGARFDVRGARNEVRRQLRACHLRQLMAYPSLTERRGLIIMVSFPDVSFSQDDAQEQWRRIANETGFRGSTNACGSVHDYFLAQSYGLFDLTFDVVGPVMAQHEEAYYGENDAYGDDLRVNELVAEACLAVQNSVDFADYDWDGDGEVEQVYLIYAGPGENSITSQKNLIWAHEWALSEYDDGQPLTIQGLTVDTYACSGELTRNGQLSGIGTICHEFAHCLGLPDLYSTTTGSSVLGAWDLMDNGNYNGSGWCPPNLSAYERSYCGWLSPEPLDQPREISGMAALGSDGPSYRIDGSTEQEYYLLENRQKEGWDRYIPRSGLLVTYVDYVPELWEENLVNADQRRYHLTHVAYRGDSLPALSLTQIAERDGMVSFQYKQETTAVYSPSLLAPCSSLFSSRTYDLGNGIFVRDGRKFFRRR